MTPRMALTYTTALILDTLARGHGYGFEIMDVTGLPSGTVYPALRRLEAFGHVVSSWEEDFAPTKEGRPARRYYTLSGEGEAVLATARRRFPGLGRAWDAAFGGDAAPA